MTAAEDEAAARALCICAGHDPDESRDDGSGFWTLWLRDVAALRAAGWAPRPVVDEAGLERATTAWLEHPLPRSLSYRSAMRAALLAFLDSAGPETAVKPKG